VSYQIPNYDDLSPEHVQLNMAAFVALHGLSLQWKRDVLALLRSDAPIAGVARDALADAIEGTLFTGVWLEMQGQEELRRWVDGVSVRRKYMEIGRFITERIGPEKDKTQRKATEAAEVKFNSSYKKCEKALYYYRDVQEWISCAKQSGEYFARLDDEQLENKYHRWHFEGVCPLSSAESYERDAALSRLAKDTAKALNRPALAEVLFGLSQISALAD
jgi:hypothetical protein